MSEAMGQLILILSFISAFLFIYCFLVLVLFVRIKGKLNANGAEIPTAWMLIVPFLSYYWIWKFSEGVETVTKKDMNTITAFLLLIFLGIIGQLIVRDKVNKAVVQ